MRFRVGGALLVVSLVAFACSGRFEFEPSASAGGASSVGGSSGSGGFVGTQDDYLECFLRCATVGLQCQSQNLICVECTADSHCGGRDRERGVCLHEIGNRCVRCEYNGDCGERSVCVDSAHACSPRCDEPDDLVCNGFGPRPSCNVSRGYCEGCRSDDDCSATPATPRCSLSRLGCVACNSDEQCPSGKYCDPATYECVSCRDSRDCPVSEQVCDPVRHTCG